MPYIAWRRWEITEIKHWFPEEETSTYVLNDNAGMDLFISIPGYLSLDNSIKSFHWLSHDGIWGVITCSENLYLYFMLVFYTGPYINVQLDSLWGWIQLPGFKASGGKYKKSVVNTVQTSKVSLLLKMLN